MSHPLRHPCSCAKLCSITTNISRRSSPDTHYRRGPSKRECTRLSTGRCALPVPSLTLLPQYLHSGELVPLVTRLSVPPRSDDTSHMVSPTHASAVRRHPSKPSPRTYSIRLGPPPSLLSPLQVLARACVRCALALLPKTEITLCARARCAPRPRHERSVQFCAPAASPEAQGWLLAWCWGGGRTGCTLMIGHMASPDVCRGTAEGDTGGHGAWGICTSGIHGSAARARPCARARTYKTKGARHGAIVDSPSPSSDTLKQGLGSPRCPLLALPGLRCPLPLPSAQQG